MPPWGPGYLEALSECRGRALDAAKAMNMSHSTVWKSRQKYPEFEKAYQEIKGVWNDAVLEGLEARSIDEAMNKSVADRIFQLKALNPPKYREKQQLLQVGGNINIILGYEPPRPPAIERDKKYSEEITANAEVLKKSTGSRKASDVLTDDDLDV